MAILQVEFKVDLQARFTNVFSWSSLFTLFNSLIIRCVVCEKLSLRIIWAADPASDLVLVLLRGKGSVSWTSSKKAKDNVLEPEPYPR